MTTLGYALLGLLAREPLTGYDLAQLLRGRIGLFWQARHSQIYPELARLEAAGLVGHSVVAQSERPDKKVYAITDAGRAAVREWATAPVDPPSPRDELVLKAYSAWLADPQQAAALFRDHEQRHAQRLAEHEERLDWLQRTYGSDLRRIGTPAFSILLALQRGIGYEREYAAWCRWAAEQFERDAEDGAAPPIAPKG